MSRIVRITRWPLVALTVLCMAVLTYRVVIMREAEAAVFPMSFFLTPTQNEVIGTLHRIGLDAQALAAAGVDDEEAGQVVADVMTYLIANPGALSTADNAYGSALAAHNACQRNICSGMADQQEITEYSTLCTSLASAESTRESALDAIFAAGADSLDEGQVALLQMIRTNREHWRNIPIEFLTIERTESEWLSLRNALAEERIVASGGGEPEAEVSTASSTLLSNSRSQETVAAAITNIGNNLAGIESAIASASQPS